MEKQIGYPSTMVNLVCPVCHCALEKGETGMQCLHCYRVFPAQGSVLCFIEQDRAAWDRNTRHQFGFYEDQYVKSAEMSASVSRNNTLLALHVMTFKMAQIDHLVSSLQLREDAKILEVGCGNGWFLQWLNNRHSFRGVGVDISPAAANLAAENDWAGNEYYAAEAGQLPFEDDSFDLVCSLDMIEHLTHEHKQDAVKEMVRVLKPEGSILLYTLHADDKYTDFWFKRTWAWLRGGEQAVRERERIAYEEEGGHLQSNFVSIQAMRAIVQESGAKDVWILPFHAMCTSAYDQYIVRFVVTPLMNLINRLFHAKQTENLQTSLLQVSANVPVAPRWKDFLVKVYQPIFGTTMKLFFALDGPFIARGHFASMFVIGRK